MAPKLLVTGGTGYIGGTVLDTLVTAHPEYEITALLRKEPDHFREKYPNVQVVKGDYDSTEILTETASKVEVVVHCGDSDHLPSLRALTAGLLQRDATQPSFLIHLSGTGILSDFHSPTYLGRTNPKVWSDIHDLDAISTRPDGELHRHTEKFIFETMAEHGDRLKMAIMCPPDIYGPGRGPGKRQSVFFPVFAKVSVEVGGAFYAGEGTNMRSWVHVEDLMQVYLKVVEAAVAGGKGADWGREGYYFASSQETTQLDIARATAKILQADGRLDSAEPKQLPVDTINGVVDKTLQRASGVKGIGAYLFASNSRTKADRASRLFGYEPKAPSLWECIEADLM